MNKLVFNDYQLSIYNHIDIFNEGLAVVRNRDELYGYINRKGQEVILCQYTNAKGFSEGLAAVQNPEGLWGYINEKGEEVIPCQFKAASFFSEGLAVVQLSDGLWTYIDKTGKKITDKVFSYATPFSEGYAVVREYKYKNFPPSSDDLYSYLGKDGNLYEKYLFANPFSNGIGIAFKYSAIVALDKSFNEIAIASRGDYVEIKRYNNDLFLAESKDRKFVYLDKQLLKKFPASFIKGRSFSEELAIVELDSAWIGFINTEGRITVFSKLHQYQTIKDFREGLAAVQNPEGLWGYINKEGKEVIPCQYKAADNFNEGLAGVYGDGEFYYIDKKGNKKIIIDNIYYSSLELEDKTITIKAGSPQELATKKLQVLNIIKEEMVQQTINMVDQIAYTETSGLYEQKSKKKNRMKKKVSTTTS